MPKSYGQLPRHLLKDALVKQQSLDPPPRPYPTSDDENARFEHKVEDVIDKQLTFKEAFQLVNGHPYFDKMQEL